MEFDDEAPHRFLAATKAGIDYSVLSVAVVTLGLIMVVEVGRHRLDHMAIGKPFFKNVLEGVYSERKLKRCRHGVLPAFIRICMLTLQYSVNTWYG